MEKLFLVTLFSVIAFNLCACASIPDAPLKPITVRVGRKDFLIVTNEKKNWFGALHSCRQRNMDLATLDTNVEHYHLVGVIKDNDIWQGYWIGGNDLEYNDVKEMYWVKEGKKMTRGNWAPNKPDNFRQKENCVHIIDDKFDGWNDNRCEIEMPFICSKSF